MTKLLDIGSANGAFLTKAGELGFEAIGVEPNTEASRYAVEVCGLNVINGEAESCCFDPGTFDIITLHDVLEHLLEPVRVLQQVRRWIKPDGLLVIDVPDGDEFSLDWRHTKPREHLWYFRLRDLRAVLKKTGFRVDSADRPIAGKLVAYCKPVKGGKMK